MTLQQVKSFLYLKQILTTLQAMQRRLADLLQAFENNRFEQCLRMSDQILKKMQKSDGKKKTVMSQNETNSLYLMRVGSLAITGQVHEANALMKQKFQAPIISEDMSNLFLQMSILAMDQRFPQFVTAINESKQKKSPDINRYMFLTHKFASLSRIFLRKYATEKNYRDSFTQIYLQYLQQLDNRKMISYQRDKVIKQNKLLDFKFVSMFLQKFITSTFKAIEEPKDKIQLSYYKKTKKQIADLKFKIAIHEGNSSSVRQLFTQYQKQIKDNIFVYLRSLKQMGPEREQNAIVWRKQFLRLFRNNLQWQLYQPIYDYSIEFINQYLQETGLSISDLSEPEKIAVEYQKNELGELYSFKKDRKQQLQNYINSLFTEYLIQKQYQQKGKKHDFYNIAVKNSLLLLLYVFNLGKKVKLAQQFVLKFKQQFGKKLTFPDQIQPYLSNTQIFTNQFKEQFKKSPLKMSNVQDQLIWQINIEKMFAKNPLKYSIQQNLKQWQRLNALYTSNLKQVQKQKKLQKGQRYLSDQFLTIEADSIRKFTEEATAEQLTQIQREELYFLILGQLETAITRSPHNHDNKLRAIYYYNKLNYYEDTLKTLESMDIKAVQFQTLGYFYLKNFIKFGNWEANDHLLTRMVKSYQENYRESSEYAFKALVGTSFNQCEENLCYCEHIDHSYNFLLLLFVFYMKNKGKANAEFYLKQILRRFKQIKEKNQFTFNADFRVMRNVMDPYGAHFVDFYGIYNNYHVLQNQTKIKLLLNGPTAEIAQEKLGQLRKDIILVQDLKLIYDFSEYSLFDKKLQYKFNDEKVHHEKTTGVQLKLINRVNKISLNSYDFIMKLRRQGNFDEEQTKLIINQIKQLNQTLANLPWRKQTLLLPSIRFHVAEIIAFVGTQIQLYSSKKKKAQGQAQKKQACQDIVNELIECVSDGIKLQERLPIDKKYLNESFAHKDQLLQRITKMNGNQFKKLYKVKI